MRVVPKLQVPWVMQEGLEVVAQELLLRYFGRVDGYKPFTGAAFESLGGQACKVDSAYVFEAIDLLAVTTLSVQVPAQAAIAMLGAHAAELTTLLREIPFDLKLTQASEDALAPGSPAANLWDLLRSYDGVGPTTASKLMARKRPDLFPIFDSVIEGQYGLDGSQGYWAAMRAALLRDDSALYRRAYQLVKACELDQQLAPLRAIDVVVWMHGKDPSRSFTIASTKGLAVPPPRRAAGS